MPKVLIIDDEESIRSNLRRILSLQGFEVTEAVDGLDGIAKLALRPDLVLCDLMMPGCNGYGVLKHLRDDPQTAAIPFVMLTASAEKEEVERSVASGVNVFLTKPFRLADLLAAIRTLVP